MCTFSVLFAKDGLNVTKISKEQDVIIICTQSSNNRAKCPSCQKESSRVHSRYIRSLNDLPAIGYRIVIRLKVRKFFCENKTCSQRIFSERFPVFADTHSRSTKRLNLALCNIGLSAGAEGGARLSQKLGMPVSGDTLLRRLHAAPMPQIPSPRIIGVDDWAYRKGRTYGTIICDLQRRCPIDLLPHRDSESLSNWLKEHPDVRIVSRDRAGVYANGINDGAPLAIQVADRWHLLKNARDTLKRITDRCRAEVRQVAKSVAEKRLKNEVRVFSPCSERVPINDLLQQYGSQYSRERRMAIYQKVRRLHQQGFSIRGIARRMSIHRRSVRKYVRSKEFPERAVSRRPSIVDEHCDYLQQRWRDGCHNASQLYRELKQAGFIGSYYSVRRYVETWRGKATPLTCQRLQFHSPSSSRVSWLLLMKAEKLTEYERDFVAELQESCPLLRSAADRLRDFSTMIREQKIEEWKTWLERASQASESIEIRNFTKSLKSDEEAVKAALKYHWSNGPVEGQINRLKTLKRQMYGRANFDLLRRRVLLSV